MVSSLIGVVSSAGEPSAVSPRAATELVQNTIRSTPAARLLAAAPPCRRR